MCLGFVNNFAQLTALRLLLGLFEGGLNVSTSTIDARSCLSLTLLPSLLASI